jgi:hypothetical protein
MDVSNSLPYAGTVTGRKSTYWIRTSHPVLSEASLFLNAGNRVRRRQLERMFMDLVTAEALGKLDAGGLKKLERVQEVRRLIDWWPNPHYARQCWRDAQLLKSLRRPYPTLTKIKPPHPHA